MVSDPAAARRRAEEALAKWEGCRVCQTWKPVRAHALSLAAALRALLAAGPEAKAPGHDRIAELESLLRECNAVCLCGCPDSEHEADECGEGCGHDDHECIRVAPAVLEIVQRYRVALSDALRAQRTPPPSDEVREAAERLRASLVAVPSWEALLPKNCGACEGESDCAGEHEPCGCHEMLAVIEASLALLYALSATASPAPGSEGVREAEAARPKGDIWDACGCPNPDDCEHVFYEPAPSDAVREAAEIVRTILTAHDARLSESGALTYGPPSKGTGFVAAIQWLRRYDAARGGE